MSQFKIGDMVRITQAYSSYDNAYVSNSYKVEGCTERGNYYLEGIHDDYYGDRLHFEDSQLSISEQPLKEGGTVMSNIVKKIKDLALSKDDRLLREQGITDDCGQLTEEGRQVLEQVVFAAHKGAVVTLVQNVADAEKAEKKKK